MESLLSTEELARLLHVSHGWVTARARDHELPGYRVGVSWRFDAAEVSAWLTRHGNATTRAPDATRRVLPDRQDANVLPPSVNLETAVTASEVADDLQVSLEAIKNWVRGGLLPCLVVRGSCLVDLDAWQQWQHIIGYPDGRTLTLPRGAARTSSIRRTIESALFCTGAAAGWPTRRTLPAGTGLASPRGPSASRRAGDERGGRRRSSAPLARAPARSGP